MSRCIEHEKYPKCVRPCTVVSVMDNLFVTVYIYSALLTYIIYIYIFTVNDQDFNCSGGPCKDEYQGW